MATATVNIPTQISNHANLAAFPVSGALKTLYIAEDTEKLYRWTGSAYTEVSQGSASGVTSFNSRTGAVVPTNTDYTKSDVGLSDVDNTSDLNKPISTATQTALDTKVDENAAIVGATKTKITYDAKGLVTSGADATTADIAASTNKNYVTDAQAIVIGNTGGTNTGDAATNSTSNTYADGKVADAINDGTTTIAPSQNAVFDALALKAPLASPTFTGNPAAPTPTVGDNDTSIATTEFVQTQIAASGAVSNRLFNYYNFI